MQVIHLDGYTLEEKLHIATDHLLPRQLQRHGLDDGRLEIESAVIQVDDVFIVNRSYNRCLRVVTGSLELHPQI